MPVALRRLRGLLELLGLRGRPDAGLRRVADGDVRDDPDPRADAVPPDLVDLLVTNAGVHAPSYAPRLLAEMYAPEDHDLLRAEL